MNIEESHVSERWENTAIGERVRAYTHVDNNDNPRGAFSNETIILCAHRRYSLGDEQFGDRAGIEARKAEIVAAGGYLQPLYLYDHGGITVSTGEFTCSWDSGQIGWIGMEADKLAERKIGPDDTEAIAAIIKSEIEIWDAYLRGAVYAYVRSAVERCDHHEEHEKEIGRQHGFYGHEHEESGLIAEAGIAAAGTWGKELAEGWKRVSRWTPAPDSAERG